jgi:hypothetical protein
MWDLEARDPSDSIYESTCLSVGVDVTRWIMTAEVHFKQRYLDPTLFNRLLERQFHAIGLALDAVQQYAIDRRLMTGYTSLLNRVDGAGKRRWEHLVTFPSRRLQAPSAPESRGGPGYCIFQSVERELLSHLASSILVAP